MTVSRMMSVMNMMKSISLVKAAGLCVLGLGLTLGGCNKQLKEDNAALQSQNAALIAENNEMRTGRDAMTAKLSDLEKSASAKTFTPPMGGGDGPTGGGGGKHTGGGGAGGGRGEVFVVAGDVLFDPGSANLKAGAKKELDGVASKIKSKHSGQSIRVEGYTDSDPLVKTKAKWKSNEGLSAARAEAVKTFLASKGISASRISAVGMGAANPKPTKKDSRRVEIVVMAE